MKTDRAEGDLNSYHHLHDFKQVLMSTLACVSLLGVASQVQGATFSVSNCNDSGTGSLRAAIASANSNPDTDTVSFALAPACSQITLASGELEITEALTIVGPGASSLAVSGSNAGRIFNFDSGEASFTITGLTIRDGIAVKGGGILVRTAGSFLLQDSVVTGNSATDTGGGLASDSEVVVTIDRTTFSNNSAELGGAIGVEELEASFTITNSSFISNTASDAGGAIYFDELEGGNLSLINVTLSANTATDAGGAIAIQEIEPDEMQGLLIQNSTIVNNTATTGGGVWVGNTSEEPTFNPVIVSTVIANNTARTSPDVFGIFQLNNSLVYDQIGLTSLAGSANNLPVGTDPLLGPLVNNGGTTLTHLPKAGSPLVNAGANPAGLANEQRGGARVVGGTADIGSVERGALQQDLGVVSVKPVPTTGNMALALLSLLLLGMGLVVRRRH